MPQFYNPNYYGIQQPLYGNSSNTIPNYQQAQAINPSNYFAWVQGEAAAKAYVVAPGTTIMLMDSENPVLYMKSTDQTGRPLEMQTRYLVTKEEYEKIQNGSNTSSEYVTKEELQEALNGLNSKFVIRKGERNGKSSV